MFVADYMTPKPQTVRDTDPVSKVEQRLRAGNFHQFPVLDESGRLVGIVTDRDIRSAVGYDANLSEKLTVVEVMKPDPTTICVAAPLDEALATLCRSRFNALPVMESGSLVGIITTHDVMRAFQEVLGLDRDSDRVEIALPNPTEDLAHAFSALKKFDGEVVSAIVSRMRRDGDEPALYLRVAGSRARDVENLMRAAGLVVLVPEHD